MAYSTEKEKGKRKAGEERKRENMISPNNMLI